MGGVLWCIFIVLLIIFLAMFMDTTYARDLQYNLRKKLVTPKREPLILPDSKPTNQYERGNTRFTGGPVRKIPTADDFDNCFSSFSPSSYTDMFISGNNSSQRPYDSYHNIGDNSLVENMRLSHQNKTIKPKKPNPDARVIQQSNRHYWDENAPNSKARILESAFNPAVEPVKVDQKAEKHVYTTVFTGEKKPTGAAGPGAKNTSSFALPSFTNPGFSMPSVPKEKGKDAQDTKQPAAKASAFGSSSKMPAFNFNTKNMFKKG